jgi:hypothetical protein
MQKAQYLTLLETSAQWNSDDSPIGKNWITRFLNYNPVLAAKTASRIDHQRAYTNNPWLIIDHFWKLEAIIRQRGLKPCDITNVDEKGFVIGY